MFKKLIDIIKKHKFTSLLIIIAITIVGYFIYQMTTIGTSKITYEVQRVQTGDIEKIISATGQIQDTDQVEVVSGVSGKVTSVKVSVGSEVKAGDILFIIDSQDLENNIYQAQLALESARIKLNQMKEPVDEQLVLRAENELITARNDLEQIKLKQEQELEKAIEERDSAQETLDDMEDDDPQYDTIVSQLAEVNRKIDSYTLNHPIEISEVEAKIKEKEVASEDAKQGASSEDIRLQEIAVEEKRSKLNNFIKDRSDYSVVALRDGTVAALDVKEGDNVSFGGGTTQASTSQSLITLISNQMEAVVIINEVDILNINEDQKALLTFDAVEDLEITGKVSDIDLIGTEDQGVISHNVTIALDSQDERLKGGMSTNVDIITASKKDIVVTPSMAVMARGEGEAVQIVADEVDINREGEVSDVLTKMVLVTTGISDDIDIEIIEGLEVGDVIVLEMIENGVEEETNSGDSQRPAGGILPFGGRAMGGGPK